MAMYGITVIYNDGKTKSYIFHSSGAYAFAERQKSKGHRVIMEKISTEFMEV